MENDLHRNPKTKIRRRRDTVEALQKDADVTAKAAEALPPQSPPTAKDIQEGRLPSRKELVDICMNNVKRAENLDDAVTVNKSVATAAEICGYIGRTSRGEETKQAPAESLGITPEMLSQSMSDVKAAAKKTEKKDQKFLKSRSKEALESIQKPSQDETDQDEKS